MFCQQIRPPVRLYARSWRCVWALTVTFEYINAAQRSNSSNSKSSLEPEGKSLPPFCCNTSSFTGSPHILYLPSANPSFPLMINSNDSAQKEPFCPPPPTHTYTQDLTLKSYIFFLPSWWKKFPLLPRIWSADTPVMWLVANQWLSRGHCVLRCYNHCQGQGDKEGEKERDRYEEKICKKSKAQ